MASRLGQIPRNNSNKRPKTDDPLVLGDEAFREHGEAPTPVPRERLAIPNYDYFLDIETTIEVAPGQFQIYSTPYHPMDREHLVMHMMALSASMPAAHVELFRGLPLEQKMRFRLREVYQADQLKQMTHSQQLDYWLAPLEVAPAAATTAAAPIAAPVAAAPTKK